MYAPLFHDFRKEKCFKKIYLILFSRGAFISKPHSSTCVCMSCRRHCPGEGPDSLRQSLIRINTYKALASPAWLCLTTQDPIHAAFKLSWELSCLARKENEFKKIYLSLSGNITCLTTTSKSSIFRTTSKIIKSHKKDRNFVFNLLSPALFRIKMGIFCKYFLRRNVLQMRVSKRLHIFNRAVFVQNPNVMSKHEYTLSNMV